MVDVDMYTFAQRLKETREQRGVSAKELSEALGLNKSTIYRYETGELKSIKSMNIKAIAKYLNVTCDYLIGASDSMKNSQEAQEASTVLTSEEKILLDIFRSVPAERQQEAIEQFAIDAVRISLKHNQ